ncbi:MAG TPA: acyl-CoA dehydrogenase family protein, partial [Ilumatobacteraceae bacterium]
MFTYDDDVATADPEMALVAETLSQLIARLSVGGWQPADAWGATFDAGLSRVNYPVGAGGLGVRPELQAMVDAELDRVGVPSNFANHAGGIGVAAPVVANFATDEQRRKYLRKIFTCEEFWCQLFSEPDAGSDLASLRSSVVRDGDVWILNGHKVWTTMGHIARRGLLLARSSNAPRHMGITCFILDMDLPGVEVRPLRQITGDAEFNEVYFTNVVVPDDCRIGAVDAGWRVAIGTLMEERNAVSHVLSNTTPPIDYALQIWASLPDESKSAARRDRLAALYTDSLLCNLTRDRATAKQLAGTPGPEGSIAKLQSGELNQAISELCVELLGAHGMLYGSYEMTQPMAWQETGMLPGDPTRALLRARANTIEGGTNE